MPNLLPSPIEGLKIFELKVFADSRGSFTESFRNEWLPEEYRDNKEIQTNLSQSNLHVLRGLHFHRNQFDWWVCTAGAMRVGVADLRRSSPTFGVSYSFDIGHHLIEGWRKPYAVFIPPGIAHGFYARTDMTMVYLVNQFYNPDDELGVAYNDPQLNINWRTDKLLGTPVLSQRDIKNPMLKDIPPEELPE